jgi:hypothetical protein
MWIPESPDEIERAIAAGTFVETAGFDGKAMLPAVPAKNRDVAVDVAAMTTNGGVLLYGIKEDRNGRLTIPKPNVIKKPPRSRLSHSQPVGVPTQPAIATIAHAAPQASNSRNSPLTTRPQLNPQRTSARLPVLLLVDLRIKQPVSFTQAHCCSGGGETTRRVFGGDRIRACVARE